MTESRPAALDLSRVLSSLPPVHAVTSRADIRTALKNTPDIPLLVVLDDDPTGTQTCHDVAVLCVWDVPTLIDQVKETPSGGGFFILTNSRALHPPAAAALVAEICRNVKEACATAGKPFEIVLRGDSTLRGHFPEEPRAVDDTLGESHAWVLLPFFLQGGRYTINDVHYVAEGDKLVPAGETPFARDATFGYHSSDLKDWVVEKSQGAITKDRVVSLSLEVIRNGGPEDVLKILLALEKGSVLVVNAAAEEDIDVVVLALLTGMTLQHTSESSWHIKLTTRDSVKQRKTLPLSYCSRVRVLKTRHIAHSADLRHTTAAYQRSRRSHTRGLLCSKSSSL